MAPITLQHNAHSNQVSLCKTLRVRRATGFARCVPLIRSMRAVLMSCPSPSCLSQRRMPGYRFDASIDQPGKVDNYHTWASTTTTTVCHGCMPSRP